MVLIGDEVSCFYQRLIGIEIYVLLQKLQVGQPS